MFTGAVSSFGTRWTYFISFIHPPIPWKISLFPLSHFRDPCSQAPSLAEPPPAVLGERAFSGDCNPRLFTEHCLGHLEDFHNLHDIVINFGSPEVFYFFFQIHVMFQSALIVNLFRKQVADQMSGNVYMHASVVEDECSKVSERWILKHLSIMWHFSAFVWLKRLESFQ